MLDRTQIRRYFEQILRINAKSDANKNVYEYTIPCKKGVCLIYIEKKTGIERLVVHPGFESSLKEFPVDGVSFSYGRDGKVMLSNSNFSSFPSLSEGGTKHGCVVEVRDLAALEALLMRMEAIPASKPDKTTAFADIEAAEPQLATLPETEREAVVAAWIGQGRFRTALMSVWSNRCAVTGVDIEDLLRASHVKPWRDSDNGERMDVANGLLLIATLDAAFDAGLICFEDDGTMLFSPRLGPNPRGTLCIRTGSVLTRPPSSRQKIFLNHHRNAVFK